MRRRTLLALLSVAVALLVGCAQQTTADQPPTQAMQPGEINWDTPLRGGLTVSSAAEAEQKVPFKVRMPRFGTPKLIQVDSQGAPEDRLVALVFDVPSYGRVVVEMNWSQWTVADMQRRADAPGVPEDDFQMVTVRGLPALLVSGQGLGRVLWIEDGVLIAVDGPTLSPEQVQELAEKL